MTGLVATNDPWPEPLDYQEAVQTPALCFKDPQLKSGKIATLPTGLPKVCSGNFASVYELSDGRSTWAIRCFLRRVTDQRDRYRAVSEHLAGLDLPSLVGFQYQDQGILVKGRWRPMIVMEWVNGASLATFVEQHHKDPAVLHQLLRQWRGVVNGLHGSDIAHGDLQHGNVLVAGAWLRLVDYDGMFVPALAGRPSAELGHPNYQHPERGAADYAEHLDGFSALVIYCSLRGLMADPGLWRFHNGENLILRRDDYRAIREGKACAPFDALKRSPDEGVRALAAVLARACRGSVDTCMDLEECLRGLPNPAAPAKGKVTVPGGDAAPGQTVEWWRPGTTGAGAAAAPSAAAAASPATPAPSRGNAGTSGWWNQPATTRPTTWQRGAKKPAATTGSFARRLAANSHQRNVLLGRVIATSVLAGLAAQWYATVGHELLCGALHALLASAAAVDHGVGRVTWGLLVSLPAWAAFNAVDGFTGRRGAALAKPFTLVPLSIAAGAATSGLHQFFRLDVPAPVSTGLGAVILGLGQSVVLSERARRAWTWPVVVLCAWEAGLLIQELSTPVEASAGLRFDHGFTAYFMAGLQWGVEGLVLAGGLCLYRVRGTLTPALRHSGWLVLAALLSVCGFAMPGVRVTAGLAAAFLALAVATRRPAGRRGGSVFWCLAGLAQVAWEIVRR